MKNPPDQLYFLINESDSLWITFCCMEIIQEGPVLCGQESDSVCVHVATYTHTHTYNLYHSV